MNNKIDLRTKFKKIRANLNITEKSQKLCELLTATNEFKTAKNILIFYPLKNEIDLRYLLNHQKNFYLPKVSEKELKICPYKNGDTLKLSSLNVYEPITKEISSKQIELAIIPALACDKNNFRLGYGGGFYDRFLSQNKHLKTIVLISKEQLVDKLPHDEFDIPVDKVITY